jgi:hypothetical protein
MMVGLGPRPNPHYKCGSVGLVVTELFIETCSLTLREKTLRLSGPKRDENGEALQWG